MSKLEPEEDETIIKCCLSSTDVSRPLSIESSFQSAIFRSFSVYFAIIVRKYNQYLFNNSIYETIENIRKMMDFAQRAFFIKINIMY